VVYHDNGRKHPVRHRIDEYAAMVHPRSGRILFAMIDAYLDESGIHEGAPVCVVAGYFGDGGKWRKFEALWKRALDDFELPLEMFNAKDLVNRGGIFEHWSSDRHSGFLRRVAAAIIECKLYPVSVGILVPGFFSFSNIQRRFLTGARLVKGKLWGTGNPNKPYFMPFQRCITNVLSHAEVGGKARFFFGLNKPFAGDAATFFEDLLEHPETKYYDRIGSLDFPLANNSPPLQAADFLVHLTYRDMIERIETNGWLVPPPSPLGEVLQRARSLEDFYYYTKEHIQQGLEMTYKMEGNWDGH
jgi:hypothetical protein